MNRGHAPSVEVATSVAGDLLHVPISNIGVGGGITVPIGYCVVSRLLPESLYLALVERWLREKPFFHYYAHTFELAGIEGLAYPGPWHPIPALYRVRMRDRRRLYERLTQRARFVSIEEVISLDAADT